MTLGLSLATFTTIHVVLSLIGIATGIVVLFGFLNGKLLRGWTGTFLGTTILTSVTGYGFPFEKLLPSHILGALSLVVLAIALFALYGRKLAAGWRTTYVVTAVIALYFNCFVLVVQGFAKAPALKALAPTQTEAPFKIAQLALLVLFIVLGVLSVRKFRSSTQPAAHKQAAA